MVRVCAGCYAGRLPLVRPLPARPAGPPDEPLDHRRGAGLESGGPGCGAC